MRCMSKHRASKTKLCGILGGSEVGAKLVLNYDYGSTSTIPLVLKLVEPLDVNERSSFPRRAPLPGQVGFVPYNPTAVLGELAANVDELFPNLSRFCFGGETEVEYFDALTL